MISFFKKYKTYLGIFFFIFAVVLSRIGRQQDIPALNLPLILCFTIIVISFLFALILIIYEKGFFNSIRTPIFWIYLILIILGFYFIVFPFFSLGMKYLINL